MAASLSGTYFTFLVLVVIANGVHILCWSKLHIDGVAILEATDFLNLLPCSRFTGTRGARLISQSTQPPTSILQHV